MDDKVSNTEFSKPVWSELACVVPGFVLVYKLHHMELIIVVKSDCIMLS